MFQLWRGESVPALLLHRHFHEFAENEPPPHLFIEFWCCPARDIISAACSIPPRWNTCKPSSSFVAAASRRRSPLDSSAASNAAIAFAERWPAAAAGTARTSAPLRAVRESGPQSPGRFLLQPQSADSMRPRYAAREHVRVRVRACTDHAVSAGFGAIWRFFEPWPNPF